MVQAAVFTPHVRPRMVNRQALKAVKDGMGRALAWDLRGLRDPARAMALINEVAVYLPFYVPGSGLLVHDWRADEPVGGVLHVRPRMDLHSESYVAVPEAVINPTGAFLVADDSTGERLLYLQMPSWHGRAGACVPLSTGLMSLSMQAHGEHVRFLPVLMRSGLVESGAGTISLHLYSLDVIALASLGCLDDEQRRRLVVCIAEKVLRLMAVPGAGLIGGFAAVS